MKICSQALSEQYRKHPHHGIEKTGENAYRITLAVAGFNDDELKVEVKEQTLTISGTKSADAKEKSYVHRGIAARSFERRFQLADHVDVTGADSQNGQLHVDLVRNVPKRMKPRSFAIGNQAETPKQVEGSTSALN